MLLFENDVVPETVTTPGPASVAELRVRLPSPSVSPDIGVTVPPWLLRLKIELAAVVVLVPSVSVSPLFTVSAGLTDPLFGQLIPTTVELVFNVIAVRVGAVDMHTKSVLAGMRPAVVPPSLFDQLPELLQLALVAPVQ
ncbi:MAG TPA: hypothetical protein VG650_09340 [Mycobacteriales bacterium]|nr:hypothetical protein [Mycobacteriales bacterium]